MSTNRQLSLDCATRIMNTKLMKGEEIEKITDKILATAEVFNDWLGPDPVKQSYGAPQKLTYPDPCPVCGGEMYDLRLTKKNPKGPDARCKKATWDQSAGAFTGCSGLVWPPKT